MKFKKLIPLFLILVLSIQYLPLQRIAGWFSSGQVTEEMTHDLDTGKPGLPPFEKDPALLLQLYYLSGHTLLTSTLTKFHSDETLLIRDADEILTPPPNA